MHNSRVNSDNDFFGLVFKRGSLNQVVEELINPAQTQNRSFHLVNAYSLVLASKNQMLFGKLKEDVLLIDGAPLAKILKGIDYEFHQIRGADLMREVISRSNRDLKHFLLGSTDKVLNDLIIACKQINSEVQIVGMYSPPFSEDFTSSLADFASRVNEVNADILWVGLGTPKQDFVIHDLAKLFSGKLLAVGAAFDYLSGNVQEAPYIWVRLKVEWLYRLLKEPKRLWKRYLVGNIQFLRIVLRHYFREINNRRKSKI